MVPVSTNQLCVDEFCLAKCSSLKKQGHAVERNVWDLPDRSWCLGSPQTLGFLLPSMRKLECFLISAQFENHLKRNGQS
jgi:hypothetical protein